MTADPLAPARPLGDARLVDVPGLVVEPGPPVAALDLRLDPAHVAAAERVLGARLPAAPDTWTPLDAGLALRLGPDEWLLTSTTATGPAWEHALGDAVAPLGGAAVDVSAQRTSLRLRGALARELLACGCALDLRPASFPAGRCAQTLIAQAGVLLVAHGVDAQGTDDLELLVRTSFAHHLAAWLVDAARPFHPSPSGGAA